MVLGVRGTKLGSNQKMNKVRKLLQTEKHDMAMKRTYNQEECFPVWIYVVRLSGYVTGTSARDSA